MPAYSGIVFFLYWPDPVPLKLMLMPFMSKSLQVQAFIVLFKKLFRVINALSI